MFHLNAKGPTAEDRQAPTRPSGPHLIGLRLQATSLKRGPVDLLERASLPYRPNFMVDALVTTGPEMYREVTEAWLHENRIAFRHLHMPDQPSAADRRGRARHLDFKADVYRHSASWVFIENGPTHAAQIHRLTAHPVFCVTTRANVTALGMARALTLRAGLLIE